MRALALLIAAIHLVISSGCSQVVLLQREDVASFGELKSVTIRTKTGEVYYFDRASVVSDTLRGVAQERRTVFLGGGDVTETITEIQVRVAMADVEQMTKKSFNWGKTGLLFIGTAVLVAGIAVAVGSGNDEPAAPPGGGGRPPPPGLAPGR